MIYIPKIKNSKATFVHKDIVAIVSNDHKIQRCKLKFNLKTMDLRDYTLLLLENKLAIRTTFQSTKHYRYNCTQLSRNVYHK
jgi:hypothetical protein